MQIIEITVNNKCGLHARPAALLTKEAAKYQSEITLKKNGKGASAKSILGVLSLGVAPGDMITIICEGEDEVVAAANVKLLMENMDE